MSYSLKRYRAVVLIWILAFMITYMFFRTGEYRVIIILVFACLGSAIVFQISFKRVKYTILYLTCILLLLYLWVSLKLMTLESAILMYMMAAIIILVTVISWIKRPRATRQS